MKVSSIKCKFKHYISTMVTCGSYMNLVLVRIWTNIYIYNKRHGSRKGSSTYMSNTNSQGIEN